VNAKISPSIVLVQLMFLAYLFVVGCAFLAFSLSAICGGGAGLLLLPILGSLLPSAQVPAALSIGTMFSSLSRILVFWRRIRWDIVLWFVPAALPAVWLGARLLSYLNPLYLELLMGLFLMANLPQIFRPSAGSTEIRPMPKWVLALIGVAAGFVSGLTGAVGLLFNRFYLRYGMKKEEIVATRAANEIMLHAIKLLLYASFGLLTHQALMVGGLVAVAAMASSWGMKWFLPRLSEGFFRRIGYTAMVVSGLSLCIEAAGQVVATNAVALDFSPLATGTMAQLQWRNTLFSLEFEYDEGFEFEHTISINELPQEKQPQVRALSQGAEKYVLEEVLRIDHRSYEVYVYRGNKLEKFDI